LPARRYTSEGRVRIISSLYASEKLDIA
jgi:hypothetical protein